MTATSRRVLWFASLAAIIAAGILSRVFHTGSILIDKYLGDALYAAMVYVILRARFAPPRAAVFAMGIMTALELFQLTMIPAHMAATGNAVVRIVARLLGTDFSFLDLTSYAIGITCLYCAERFSLDGGTSPFIRK